MRDVDRRIRCSDLNNELREANIKLNKLKVEETNARNAILVGNGDISRHEYEITQINVELALLEAGGLAGGRAAGLVTAGRIAQLKSKKRKLEDKIATTKREIQQAKRVAEKAKDDQDTQRRLIR